MISRVCLPLVKISLAQARCFVRLLTPILHRLLTHIRGHPDKSAHSKFGCGAFCRTECPQTVFWKDHDKLEPFIDLQAAVVSSTAHAPCLRDDKVGPFVRVLIDQGIHLAMAGCMWHVVGWSKSMTGSSRRLPRHDTIS